MVVVRSVSNAATRSTADGSDNNTQEDLRRVARRSIRRCHKCQDNYKPPRAHHDSVTGRCIVKFDHFCPWTGNAIGALNHKFFFLFVFYTAISCLLSILLLLIRLVHCGYMVRDEEDEPNLMTAPHIRTDVAHAMDHPWMNYSTSTPSENTSNTIDIMGPNNRNLSHYAYEECNHFFNSHAVLLLVLASILFLIFTVAIACEQIDAIQTGQGKIARMKMRVGQSGTEFARVTEEFNELFGGSTPHMELHWFNPWQPVEFPRGMKKVVLGYEWDETIPPVPYRSDDDDNDDDDGERQQQLATQQQESLSSTSSDVEMATPPKRSSSDSKGRRDDQQSLLRSSLAEVETRRRLNGRTSSAEELNPRIV